MITPISLTPPLRDTLLVIQELYDLTGVMPSQREIARELCTNVGNVHRMLGRLCERGWLRCAPRGWRGVQILHRIEPPPIDATPAIELTARGLAAIGVPAPATFHGKQS